MEYKIFKIKSNQYKAVKIITNNATQKEFKVPKLGSLPPG